MGPGRNVLTSFTMGRIYDPSLPKRVKSSGLPDIPIRLVKGGAEALARPVTQLMNRTFNEGTLPVDWRYAVVTPVHKAGSKSDPSSYPPISVLSLFSNILERAAVHRMVYSYLQDHNILLR